MWQYLVVAIKLSIILYFELYAIRDIYFFHTVVSTDCDENVYIVYFVENYFLTDGHQKFFFDGFCIDTFEGIDLEKSRFFCSV